MSEQQKVHIHCQLPQRPAEVIGVNQFQCAYREARNSKQRLRAALRTLSSMGYLTGMYDDKWVREIIEEFQETE